MRIRQLNGFNETTNQIEEIYPVTHKNAIIGIENVNNTSDLNKPVSTAQAAAIQTAVNNHNINTSAHNDIRLFYTELNTKINNFLNVDDKTKDQLSEIIALIEANADDIESITSGKVNVTDIINNLTTNVSNKPLSAAQGVILKGFIDTLSENFISINQEGNVSTTGTIINQIPISTDIDGSIYNEIGYKNGYRWSSSGKKETEDSSSGITGYIPFTSGSTLRIKNISDNISYPYIVLFDSTKTVIQTMTGYGDADETGVYTKTISVNNLAFVRIVGATLDNNAIITVNQAIEGNTYNIGWLKNPENELIAPNTLISQVFDYSGNPYSNGVDQKFQEIKNKLSSHDEEISKIEVLQNDLSNKLGKDETAVSADKLSTYSKLKVDLASTSSTYFNGSENIENIGVSGVLSLNNGGTSANTIGQARNNLYAMPLILNQDGNFYQLGIDDQGIYITNYVPGFHFYIEGKRYFCAYEEGTWGQWCESEYNTDNYSHAYTSDSPIYSADRTFKVGVNAGSSVMFGHGITQEYNYVLMSAEAECCFIPGTQILISSNGETKNIENFKTGDKLISYNINTGELYETICQGLITNKNTTDIAEVEFCNGIKLTMNAYHPILTVGGFKSLTGYDNYDILKIGDIVICDDGFTEIININRYNSKPITTYNLMVKDINESPDIDTNDTYVANGIIVHNAACPT